MPYDPVMETIDRTKTCEEWMGSRGSIRLRDLLVLAFLSCVLASVWMGVDSRARLERQKVECATHLSRLGSGLYMWSQKFTNSAGTYPPYPWPEHKLAVGREVLDSLRTYPTRQTSMTRGDDSLFACPVRGTVPSPQTLDYRGPSPRMPGGLVSPLTRPDCPVACDRPTNHDPSGQDDMNVLLYSGEVLRATSGSPEWNTAVQYTQDP